MIKSVIGIVCGAITGFGRVALGGARAEEFLTTWCTFHDIQRRQPGFLSNRMHRAADEDTRFRFVNVSQWGIDGPRSAVAGDEFRQRVAPTGPEWNAFGKSYGRYEVLEQDSTA